MPKARRFELLRQRSRSDAPLTSDEFEIRESREGKWGINEALDDADYIILNTGTLEDLKESFNELLNIIQELER
jgi:dephospho-CoA kinase